MSDLLLSWRLPSPVELPTQSGSKILPGIGADHAAGLAQKLVIVRPFLLIAWAGDRSEAHRIILDLEQTLPMDRPELGNLYGMFAILNSCAEGTEMVALFISDAAVHPFGVRTRGFELEGRRVYLLGTGAGEMFKYLQTHPELLPDQEHADGQIAQATLLRFAARAMVSQWIAGTGLTESWGGGFEVVYPEREGFRKITNVLFRGWLVEGSGKYRNSGRSFFSRYYGNDLYLSCFNPGEQTYIVRSPIGAAIEIPVHEVVSPQWTIDCFWMQESGSLVDMARFQPHCRPVKDKLTLRNGMLVGWDMDQAYLEECVATAINSQQMNAFSVRRY